MAFGVAFPDTRARWVVRCHGRCRNPCGIACTNSSTIASRDGGQLLGEHPDQRHEWVADPDMIPGAVEETLRFEPPSPVQAHYVAQDVELYGHTVTEGSYMLLLNGSANRDESHFTDPDRFDIHR